jgi:cytoplasmic iron level regulating protein YaaA (DUF328/UPF0246 family)
MRAPISETGNLRQPQLIEKAQELDTYLKTLSPKQLSKCMHLSPALAEKTHELIQMWTADPKSQSMAIDTFLGDIYSGLHAGDLSAKDREYADKTLIILSGLYGCIRPFDGIYPYRLEMGYKLPSKRYANLYKFWGEEIAKSVPPTGNIVNLSAVEYSQTITPFVDPSRVITPHFMTASPKTGEPTFVVVHAKIARGAFARFLITERIEDTKDLSNFSDLGYELNKQLSTEDKPVFVCQEFGGKGRSIRLLT